MQAKDVVVGMTIMGDGVVTAIQHFTNSVHFIFKGGSTRTVANVCGLDVLPARDAKGRFMPRVHLVLAYCAELGDIVTTHVGVKAAKLARALHLEFFPNGSAVIA